jgi:tol-pal system protein YbgF
MHRTTQIVRAGTLLLCLFCSACLSMQQQIDTNAHDLAQMRNQNARFQATTHNEVEQLRSEIQTLSGTLEENNVVHGQEIKDIKKRLGSLTATLGPVPLNTGENAALHLTAGASTASLDNAQSYYDQALKLYYDRDYEKSYSSFQTFLTQYRSNPLAQNAFFWIGMSLFQQKKYRESISALEDLIKEFPQGGKVPDAYYWQAVSFIELEEMLTAQILLETLMQTYPSSEATQKAQTKYQELKFDTSR